MFHFAGLWQVFIQGQLYLADVAIWLPLVAWPTSKTSKIFESTPVSSPSGDNAV
jgi:hypothetical protein